MSSGPKMTAQQMMKMLSHQGRRLADGVKQRSQLSLDRVQRLRQHRKRLRIWDRPPQPLLFVDVWGIAAAAQRKDVLNHLVRLGIAKKPYVHLDWRGGCEGEPEDTGGTAFLVFEDTRDAAQACKLLQSSSLLGNTLEAEMSVHATLKDDPEAQAQLAAAAAAGDADEDWRGDQRDGDAALPDWDATPPPAGRSEAYRPWKPHSIFEVVGDMAERRGRAAGGTEEERAALGAAARSEVTWLRLSPVSRFATREDIALFVDRVLSGAAPEGGSEDEDGEPTTAIRWFSLNPMAEDVEVQRSAFIGRIKLSDAERREAKAAPQAPAGGTGGDEDGDTWTKELGGFDRRMPDEFDAAADGAAAPSHGELALLAVDPLVDNDLRQVPFVLLALSDRAAAQHFVQLGRQQGLSIEEVVNIAGFNERQLSSFHSIDARTVHITRVAHNVSMDDMLFLLRGFDVEHGTLRKAKVLSMNKHASWVVSMQSEEEAKRAVRELHQSHFSVTARHEVEQGGGGGGFSKLRDPRFAQIIVLPMR